MADSTTDTLIQNIAQLQRTIDKLADNIFGGAQTRKRREREKPNTEKLATAGRDPVKEAAQALRTEKALKDLKKSLDDSFKDTKQYGNDMRVAGAAFENATKKISLKQFDELPKKLTALINDERLQFKTTADIHKTLMKYDEENIDAMLKLKEELLHFAGNAKKTGEIMDELNRRGFHDFDEDLNRTREELVKLGTITGKAVNNQTKEIEKNATSTGRWTKAILIAEGAAILLAGKFMETLVAADKYGTTVKSTGVGMTELGMSAESFAKLQNENLPTLNASGKSLDEFNTQLRQTSWSLLTYTGSLEDGAKLAAQANKQSVLLTANGPKQNQYIQQNIEQFKKMHDIVGTTSEQYLALNDSLMSNQSVQTNLYRLNDAQRAQAVTQLKQDVLYLQTQGLELEQAKGVVEMFQELNAQSPKNRRKQAAEVMAVGGALGLGKESAELGQLLIRGARTPEEKHRQIELEAQIQRATQAKYAATEGGGAAETVINELMNRPGVQKIFGDQGAQALIGQRGGAVISPEKQFELQQKGLAQISDGGGFWNMINHGLVGIESVLKGFWGKGLMDTIGAAWALYSAKGVLQTMLGRGAATAAAEGIGGTAVGGAAAATATVAATAAVGVLATGAVLATIYSGFKALRGEDASNIISDWDKSSGGGIGDWMGAQLDKWGGIDKAGANATKSFTNYSKTDQVQQLMEQYNTDAAKGDQVDMDALMKRMDDLVTAMAKADSRDPAKAVDNLHKTIKNQHQENKAMTQEQIDAAKGQTDVRLVKTTHGLT